jgi:signal peptidase I
VVVFNLPVEHPDSYQKYSNVLPDLHPHPADLRSNYIKRCVAIAGDKLEIRGGQVFVNGKPMQNPPRLQNEYFVSTTTQVNEENIFHKNGIADYAQFTETFGDSIAANDQFGYIVKTTSDIVAKLKTYDFVKRIDPVLLDKGLKEPFLFPGAEQLDWNKDNFGPIIIPKKGANVQLNEINSALYGEVIKNYDGNSDIAFENGRLTQRGKILETYTFKQDYYFMMGDNRHDSADSRYWGFVPKDHIVGKAVFVWMSIDPNPTSFLRKIRWDRIFRIIG